MVVVTHISTSSLQISPSFFHLRLRIPATSPTSSRIKRGDGGGGIALSIRAYIEKPNSISSFANTVIGSLPVIGLLARILSDEGGVGRDLVDFSSPARRFFPNNIGEKYGVVYSDDLIKNHGADLISDAIPTRKAVLLQIYVAMKTMPWYTLLPTVSEFMIESGWTKCYCRIGEFSWIFYLVSIATHLVLVEFGIYWMHRELHDIKPLYKIESGRTKFQLKC